MFCVIPFFENRLVDDAARLRLLLENVPGLIAFVDRDFRFGLASCSHSSWFGMGSDDVKGRHVRDVMGTDAYELLKPHFDKALAGGLSIFVGNVPFAHGGERFVRSTAIATERADTQTPGLLLVTTDLTERRLMEKALDASNRRAHAVLETSMDGIITIDEKGTIQSFNRGAERQFGYTADDVIGRNVKMLMPAVEADMHDAYLKRYLETGERRVIGIGREVTARRKDGSEFPMELALGEFMEDSHYYFTGFTRDISDRKAAELEARVRHNQLYHSARLNSLGELGTSIAHEVSQPLTAIVTMSQALLRYIEQDSDVTALTKETLEKIIHQGKRAGEIVEHIRDFVRSETADNRVVFDINAIITNALQLLEYEFERHDVDLQVALDPDLARVRINKIQIEQVFVNLIQNALQAMADTREQRVLSVVSRVESHSPPQAVVLIRDTGHGLPEGEESRVFEPFFTTRPGGLGQGLSICTKIVEAHGGTLRAVRNEGPGATFVVSLPVDGEA